MITTLDLREQYQRVVEWNIKAGKLPDPVLPSDILFQEGLVREELDELMYEIKLADSTQDADNEVECLKEFCDVFVTATYLDYLHLAAKDEMILPDVASQVMLGAYDEASVSPYENSDFFKLWEDSSNLQTFKLLTYILKYIGTPVEEILDAVLDNNDLKLFTNLSEADEQLTLLDNEEDYYIDTNSYGGTEYYCVKRKSDNKVMKPKNLPKVDIQSILDMED